MKEKHLHLPDELRAAEWAMDRINIAAGGLVLFALLLCAKLHPMAGIPVLIVTVYLYLRISGPVRDELRYRRKYFHFAQLNENIVCFSEYPGDNTVLIGREHALEWLKITGNTRVKVLSGIYDDTRFFVHSVSAAGSVSVKSYERQPEDFRPTWERWTEMCRQFRDRIDRQTIEEFRRKDDLWTDVYLFNQAEYDAAQN